jgi:XTP/dITP diphosphohydrolase
MEIVFATRNAHKAAEVAAILEGAGLRLLSLADFPGLPEDIPESQDTFEGNAIQKARFVFEAIGVTAIADDSGLEVDALGGLPGVRSKRFTPEATAASNNALLLECLADLPDRRARFRCVVAVVGPGLERIAEGRCEGRIGHSPRGEGGFGYDPLFLPEETPGRTMAELGMAEKNAISHRGRAFRRMAEILGAGTPQ